MLRIYLFFLPVVLLHVGCSDDGAACTEEARPSVLVSVVDGEGDAIEDADVRYSVDGATSIECSFISAEIGYSCGVEDPGGITVNIDAAGFVSAEETVTVELTEDECHVVTEELTVTLAAE